MLDEGQKAALGRWYRRPKVLDEARELIEGRAWEDLEEHLHMHCLLPLGRTEELPDYLKKDDGTAVLPSLDPSCNLEAWRDAIEVGWEVVESELGITRDEVHRAIAKQQQDNWDAFMARVEERERQRGKE